MAQDLQTILKEASEALRQSIQFTPTSQRIIQDQSSQGSKETLLIRCRDSIYSLQQELNEERTFRQEMQTNYKQATEQIQSLQSILQETQQRLNKINDINLDLESQIYNLKSQVAHANVEVEKFQNLYKSEQQEFEQKSILTQEQEDNCQELQKKLHEQIEINKSLSHQITQMEIHIQKQKNELIEISQIKQKQDEIIQQIRSEKLSLERQINDQHIQLQQQILEEKKNADQRENFLLTTFKSEQEEHSLKTQMQIEEIQRKADEYKAINSKLKKEIMQYQELSKELKSKQEMLQVTIDQRVRDLKNIKNEFKNKQIQQQEEKENEKKKFTQQVEFFEQESKKFAQQIENLNKKMELSESHKLQAQKSIQKLEEIRKADQEYIQKLQGQIEQLREQQHQTSIVIKQEKENLSQIEQQYNQKIQEEALNKEEISQLQLIMQNNQQRENFEIQNLKQKLDEYENKYKIIQTQLEQERQLRQKELLRSSEKLESVTTDISKERERRIVAEKQAMSLKEQLFLIEGQVEQNQSILKRENMKKEDLISQLQKEHQIKLQQVQHYFDMKLNQQLTALKEEIGYLRA